MGSCSATVSDCWVGFLVPSLCFGVLSARASKLSSTFDERERGNSARASGSRGHSPQRGTVSVAVWETSVPLWNVTHSLHIFLV